MSALVRFAPYRAGDALAIHVAREGKVPPSVDDLAQQSWAFTALAAEQPVAVGGIYRMEHWRGLAWSVLAHDIAPRALVLVRRRAREALALAHADGMHTIETEVALGFVGGHTWVRSLGFRFAGVVPGYNGDGACFVRYAHTTAAAQWPSLRVQACLDLTERVLADSFLRAREHAAPEMRHGH